MSVEIDVVYEGNLRCKAVHLPSGTTIETDAPTDNGGRGEKFSPTDLVAAALGSCTLTIMGHFASRMDVNLAGTKVHVVKDMDGKSGRKIGTIALNITFPEGLNLTDEQRAKLEKTVSLCPVGQSISSDIKVEKKFIYS